MCHTHNSKYSYMSLPPKTLNRINAPKCTCIPVLLEDKPSKWGEMAALPWLRPIRCRFPHPPPKKKLSKLP